MRTVAAPFAETLTEKSRTGANCRSRLIRAGVFMIVARALTACQSMPMRPWTAQQKVEMSHLMG